MASATAFPPQGHWQMKLDAALSGNEVLLETAGGPAGRVRFCWGDAPVCNLYDKSGPPAGPLEIAIAGPQH
jgi:sialate O-acetylesterase